MNTNKKLYKDIDNKMICGVLSGFAQYINGDVTLVRILFVLLTIVFNPCIIIYIIASIVMPYKNEL